MATKNRAILQSEAVQIRDESTANANTALRIGQHLYDNVDSNFNKTTDNTDNITESATKKFIKPSPDPVAFTGALDLSRKDVIPYNDYDVSASGAITFSIGGSAINFGVDYFRIVSDGLSAFATEANLNAIFNTRYGVPVAVGGDIILPSGTYEIFCYKTPSGAGISIPGNVTISETDSPPVATLLNITGSLTVGATITGNYTYYDADGDTESGTTFKWYRADDAGGTNRAVISGATSQTYLLQAGDLGKFIQFGVTPSNANGTGDEALSNYTTEIQSADTTAPVATFNPADTDIDVPIGDNLLINFNEAIRNTDSSEITDANVDALITLAYGDGGMEAIPFDATINAGKTQVTVNPTSDLDNGRDVTISINNFEDEVGNEETTGYSATFTMAAAGIDDGLPYFEDAVIYFNFYEGDQATQTHDVSNNITSITDRVSGEVISWDTNQPIWDDTNKCIEMSPLDAVSFSDRFATAGDVAGCMSGIWQGSVQEFFTCSNNGPRDWFIGVKNNDKYWQHREWEPIVHTITDSELTVDAVNDKCVIGVRVDTVTPSCHVCYLGDNHKEASGKTVATNTPSLRPVNKLEFRSGTNSQKIRAWVLYNRVLSLTELKEVQDFLAGQLGIIDSWV